MVKTQAHYICKMIRTQILIIVIRMYHSDQSDNLLVRSKGPLSLDGD